MSSLQSFESSQQKRILQSTKQFSAKVHHQGSHRVAQCRVTKRCQKCGRKHHTSIHSNESSKLKGKENNNNHTKQESSSNTSSKQDAKVLHSHHDESIGSSILLATARVLVISATGQSRKLRALVDQGSEAAIITERVVQQLNLPRVHSSVSLTGIGAKNNQTKGTTSFLLKPHFLSEFEVKIQAYILPKLTSSMPSLSHNKDKWDHLKNLKLADPDFHKKGKIDLIIGADIYSRIIKDGIIRGEPDTPIAQATRLGWIVSGVTSPSTTNPRVQGYHVSITDDIHNLLKRFWETEEISINAKTLTKDEQDCEDHFEATHSRDATGRYIVKLPFKDAPDKLGNSKSKAIRVMTNLRHRFSSNVSHAKLYEHFIKEYEDLNHMKRVQNSQDEPDKVNYLPHHGVYREQSLSTKLRVVVNASNERYPPSKWPLGRVTETHARPDGHIRVVTVKTQFSECKLPIVKICPLEVEST
ncbi:uncharacterized protein LOC112457272, partial [Temnothorax curvispinosus]|uniref:Uncharacterized protein LOC112452941 n=1 Tax=Temnothorax curvispinosus TaxID=300111 RepID=A0A6J1PIK4_9HYME